MPHPVNRISEITGFPSLSLISLMIEERFIVSSCLNAAPGTGIDIMPSFTVGRPQQEATWSPTIGRHRLMARCSSSLAVMLHSWIVNLSTSPID